MLFSDGDTSNFDSSTVIERVTGPVPRTPNELVNLKTLSNWLFVRQGTPRSDVEIVAFDRCNGSYVLMSPQDIFHVGGNILRTGLSVCGAGRKQDDGKNDFAKEVSFHAPHSSSPRAVSDWTLYEIPKRIA
jgi:hypothetical protein